ncbi:MAG: redox-regulated ATPase YchF [Candidatus Gracilibacteria bacterium]|nr:redox-regulated ATPase YchF [Candidatus Gracilibacteria bacterium]MDD2908255.1 redox-regulated ATPase YchF [Candidatus Gracilibacteria bacterium]
MKVGIVGLPNVGKSSLFNVLTKSYAADAQNFPFCTIEPNTGIVNVNDERLEALQKTVNGEKIIPATVEFVDIAGIVEGASKGEGLGNKFLANIREADAILQVVRLFEDTNVHHVSGTVDPKRDTEIISAELIIADLETLDKRFYENEKKAKSGDKEAKAKSEVYLKLKPHLESGNLAITLDLDEEERNLIKDLFLLTNKPFVYACNVSESQLNLSENDLRNQLGITDKSIPVLPISVKMELDMLDFSPEDRKEYLAGYGITTNPTDILIKTCFSSLGLQYYFTAGEIEVHAWVIKTGWKAPQAAGRIHTDFEKKFIKADVTNWKDLVESGGWAKARELGKVKMEGKEYIVQDGDVMIFKFGG